MLQRHSDHNHAGGQATVRVVIQQPSLAAYRVPVYRELAQRKGIDLRVRYGQEAAITNVAPDGFDGQGVKRHRWAFFGHPVYWHSVQLHYASRAQTDVLVLSWDLHYASLVPAMLKARLAGVPTVLWGHGYSKREAGWRAKLRMWAAKLGTALLFYNHTTAQRYLDMGFEPSRVFVALNALDQAPIQEARRHWLDRPDALEEFRQRHGLKAGPVVLFVSRFDPVNRLDLLIRAIERLRADHPTVTAVIVGKGEPEESNIRRLAQSLGVEDHVRFPGAIYDERELAPWFLSAQAFCYPANIGLSILHAFGYGLPVVTGDRVVAQNPEIEALRDGENGLVYTDGDDSALAATLDRLFRDPSLAKRLGQEAHRTVMEHFSLANMVDGMEAAVRFCAHQRCQG